MRSTENLPESQESNATAEASAASQSESPGGKVGSVAILGTGRYVPERVLTNADLEKIVDTTDEWITSRTGIKERRMAADDQATSDLASEASKNAIEQAGIDPEEIDLIIVATISPDMFFPSTAAFVQAKIGASNAIAYDISAACSGYLYAIQLARQSILMGSVKTALVIGAEKLSTFINWEDRATCVLFGDGAGAMILRGDEADTDSASGHTVVSTDLGTDGTKTDILKIPGGGSALPLTAENIASRPNTIYMEGQEVFKQAVTAMSNSCVQAIDKAGLTNDDISLVIAHQANKRIIDAISKRLKLGEDQTYVNVDRFGNTSAASIAIALDEAHRAGRLNSGDNILLVAFGAGLTWASAVLRW